MSAPTLEHTYADAVPALNLDWDAAPVTDPRVVVLDEDLARELGLDPAWLRSADGVAFLTGHGGGRTVAQGYAGHQFGGYSPRLGDGRALLLGELVTPDGRRVDLHLKGSGRTPWSRGGDGLAVLGPMLREHLMGAWMHALGIPTTRALAVLTTGDRVLREGPQPGAILVRVAASHLRVGTVQLAASTGDAALLGSLVDHAAWRHPGTPGEGGARLAFFDGVVQRQADLVARWMSVGFVHGVMNTDNTTLSGETIDYGPCAVLDGYDPRAVFSSIDTGGRYAYGNQPAIGQWNLARLAEALLPLDADASGQVPQESVDRYVGVLDTYPARYETAFAQVLARRGIDAERAVAEMTATGADLTTYLREHGDPAANSLYVPRNHLVEAALAAATAGDLAPYERLLDAVTRPFTERPGLADLVGPAPADAPPHVTYCGT